MRCRTGKKFTVVRVNGNPHDTYAAEDLSQAMAAAIPDRGAKIEVFEVCSRDAGAARLPSEYERRGRLVRTFRTAKDPYEDE